MLKFGNHHFQIPDGTTKLSQIESFCDEICHKSLNDDVIIKCVPFYPSRVQGQYWVLSSTMKNMPSITYHSILNLILPPVK